MDAYAGGSRPVLCSLASIDLPESITTIGAGAFVKTNLEEIDTKNATGIGAYCFEHSPSLRKITANIRSMYSDNSNYLNNLPQLQELHLGPDVKSINGWDLPYCPKLAVITVHKDNPYIKAVDNVVFSKDGATLLLAAYAKTGVYTVPDGVTTIQSHAFRETSLSGILFPEGLETIQGRVFSSVNGLTKLSLPASVKNLGATMLNSAFTLHSIDATRCSGDFTMASPLASDDASTHPKMRILYVNTSQSGKEQTLLNNLQNNQVPAVVAQTNGKVLPASLVFEEGVLACPKVAGQTPVWYTDAALTQPLEGSPEGGKVYYAKWEDGAPERM